MVSSKVTCLEGMDNTGLTRQIISLVLMRKFQTDWFKVTFLGGAENVIKSWFALLGTHSACCVFSFNKYHKTVHSTL